MNSNLNRALAAALVALGGVASAVAQFDSGAYCADPNNTAPYSTDYNYYAYQTRLFGAVLGVSGAVTYGTQCDSGGPIRGRIGFTLGTNPSYQDDDPNQAAAFGGLHDDFLQLNPGEGFNLAPGSSEIQGDKYSGAYVGPPPGGVSYARIYLTRANTSGSTTTSYLFGNNAFTYAYYGLSGRFMLAEGTPVAGITARLNIDVIADAARLTWTLTNTINTTDTVAVGLYFGQEVVLIDETGALHSVPYGDQTAINSVLTTYITTPGRRPLQAQERFNNTGLDPQGDLGGATIGVPPYVNFTMNQTAGFGLQVVNNASALTGFDPGSGLEQTPVDEFVLGESRNTSGSLIDGFYNSTDPQFADFIFNPPGLGNADAGGLPDTGFGSGVAYLQKWQPVALQTGAARTITSYYRATNFDTSYNDGSFNSYAVSVDTPKVVSTSAAAITTSNPFTPNPFTIRVNVDNTGGFSNLDTQVALLSTSVTLKLPAGMFDPITHSPTITQTIPRVDTTQIAFVDFQVAVDPNLSGAQQYSVTVQPQAGNIQPKTIYGSINVATAPKLNVQAGANLVSPPWQFADSTWETVLGLSLNTDFQAYTWDSLTQKYITQPSAQRGVGTWIVSQGATGFETLGGSPVQPDDEFPDPNNYDTVGGAGNPTTILHFGWNLVGNPYNYSFPIGNLVGIPASGSSSLTFADLVNDGYTDGRFAYYDPQSQGYLYLSPDPSTPLPPNNGYWIYANQDFILQFPPLFELFLRGVTPTTTEPQKANNWRLQLAASSATAQDVQNFVGIAPDVSTSRAASARKPPMPLTVGKRDVLSSYVTGDNGASMARMVRASQGAQTFIYNVLSKNGGAVTVSWPNLKAIPSNLVVKVTDPAKKKTVDARSAAGYTISTKAATVYPLTISVGPTPVPPENILSASYSYVMVGGKKQMQIGFMTSGKGSATLTASSKGTVVSTFASNVGIVAGKNVVNWNMTNSNGQPLPNGTYVVTIKAMGEDGSVATRQLSVLVRR